MFMACAPILPLLSLCQHSIHIHKPYQSWHLREPSVRSLALIYRERIGHLAREDAELGDLETTVSPSKWLSVKIAPI